jgi:hypothetical protein
MVGGGGGGYYEAAISIVVFYYMKEKHFRCLGVQYSTTKHFLWEGFSRE